VSLGDEVAFLRDSARHLRQIAENQPSPLSQALAEMAAELEAEADQPEPVQDVESS
jgi:hypothetical protein